MADTTKVVRIVVDASGAQQGSSQVTSALERIDRQRQRTQSGLQALAAANASASARMIAGMSAVNNASLRMIEGMSQAGRAAAALNTQLAGAANTNRRFGSAIQQAGFQVGDFAVQIASGTNPLRAFIQQGTQLVSMFGPWGAVIGAAGAVVGALAMAFLDLGDATDDATRAQERYAEAQETAKRLMEETGRLSEIKQKSLEAEKMRLLEAAKAELEKAQAFVTARQIEAQAELGAFTVGVTPEMVENDPGLRALRDAAFEAQKQLSILNAELGLYADGRSRITETTDAIARSVEKAEKKVRTFADVLADLNQKAVVQKAKEYADAIKLIERTVESGLTEQQRYERQVKDLNRALELAAERGYKLSIEAQEALNRAMREADPAARAAREAYEKQQRERERMAEEEAKILRKPFENALDGIQDSFTDFFQSVFDGGIDSFRDLASGIKSIFTRLAAEIAALLVFRPVVAGILGGVGLGSIAGGMGLMPTSGGLPGGVGIGDLFGIGKEFLGSGSGIGQWLFGAAQNGKILPTSGWLGSGGQFLGSTFLAEAFLPGLGALLPGLIGGNVKQAGLGLGGALLGTAIGGPIGGVVGGLLGNLVGDLFGGKKKTPQAVTSFDLGGGLTEWTRAGGNIGATNELAKGIADTVGSIVASIGGTLSANALGGYILTSTGKNQGTIFLGGVGQYGSGTDLDKIFGAGFQESIKSDPNAIAEAVAVAVIRENARIGAIAGLSATQAKVLRRTDASSLQALNADLAFAQWYEQVTGLAPETTQAAEAIKALKQQFKDAREEAARLGLNVSKLTTAEAQAIAKLTTDFNRSISDQILGLTDPLALALQQLEEAQAARLKEAKELGADLVQVERLTALERQKVVEQFGGSLRSFFDEITFGGLSGASPGASLEGARAAFEAAAAQGNIAGIETYGRAYLESARAFYASGTGFQEALARVQSVVGAHVAGNDNQVVSSLNSGFGNLSAQMNALITINAGLRQDNAELRAEIRSLLDRLQALAA